MAMMKHKPDVFINASAIGFYGMSDEMVFTENTTTPGDDFLANVVTQWEQTAKQAEDLNIRTVYTRFGVILGEQGALPLMSFPVKLYVGGKIGTGNQYISWVHIDDVVQLIIYCIHNQQVEGPINVTAPTPQQNHIFMKILASVLKRPYWLTVPAPIIRTIIGQMSTLVTEGQYVLPVKAEKLGYTFKYSSLEDALKAIFN